jgi:hypothetical protein
MKLTLSRQPNALFGKYFKALDLFITAIRMVSSIVSYKNAGQTSFLLLNLRCGARHLNASPLETL